MSQAFHISSRKLAGHILAALSYASFLGAVCAISLLSIYHGHLEQSPYRSSYWSLYFDFGIFQVDHRWMLFALLLMFVVLPIVLGAWLAARTTEPRFESLASFIGFGVILLVGLGLNLYIAFLYAITNYNSSAPF